MTTKDWRTPNDPTTTTEYPIRLFDFGRSRRRPIMLFGSLLTAMAAAVVYTVQGHQVRFPYHEATPEVQHQGEVDTKTD